FAGCSLEFTTLTSCFCKLVFCNLASFESSAVSDFPFIGCSPDISIVSAYFTDSMCSHRSDMPSLSSFTKQEQRIFPASSLQTSKSEVWPCNVGDLTTNL